MVAVNEPRISYEDARQICGTTWPTVSDALVEAGRLERAGWRLGAAVAPRRQDGALVLARVVHRVTGRSPGEIVFADPPRHGEAPRA